jgi:hypothetical protein
VSLGLIVRGAGFERVLVLRRSSRMVTRRTNKDGAKVDQCICVAKALPSAPCHGFVKPGFLGHVHLRNKILCRPSLLGSAFVRRRHRPQLEQCPSPFSGRRPPLAAVSECNRAPLLLPLQDIVVGNERLRLRRVRSWVRQA